jgi:hypothetical protein
MLLLARRLTPLLVAGEEVVVRILVQVRLLVIEALLVVEVSEVRLTAALVVPLPWFKGGCRIRSSGCFLLLNHNC